jgi:nucleotide-binding universal stress UspA family protein
MNAILVPVDGSVNALHAVDLAIAQAKRIRGQVHLLNVQLLPDTYGTVREYLVEVPNRELTTQRAKAILKPAVARLQRARVPHNVHIIYGDIAPTIVRAASRLKCESIIMGTRGLGPIGGLLLGSVATKVIHLAKKPVTLIK